MPQVLGGQGQGVAHKMGVGVLGKPGCLSCGCKWGGVLKSSFLFLGISFLLQGQVGAAQAGAQV